MRSLSTATNNRPQTSGSVEQQRFFALLDSVSERRILWLAAPSGSGKTSLISAYLEDRQLAAIHLQADQIDFIQPDSQLYPLGSTHPKAVLVIDDDHQAPADPAFHSIPAAGLESLSRKQRIIIISRDAPPEQFSQLRLEARMIVIDCCELGCELSDLCILTQKSPAPGQKNPLIVWLRQLPEELSDEIPWLSYWHGIALLPYDPRLALQHFDKAFQGFLFQSDRKKVETDLLLAWSGAVEAIVLEREEAARLDPWVDWLDSHLTEKSRPLDPSVERRVTTAMIGAILLRHLRHPQVQQWLDRGEKLAIASLDEPENAGLLINLVSFYLMAEGIARGVHLLQLLEQQVTATKEVSPLIRTGWCLLKAIEAHWVEGSGSGAAYWAEQGLSIAAENGTHVFSFSLLCQGVHGGLTMDCPDTAHLYLKSLAELLPGSGPWHRSYYHFLSGWLDLCQGNTDKAREHLRSALILSDQSGATIPRAFSHAGMAQLLVETHHTRMAEQHLNMARSILPADDDNFAFMYLIIDVQIVLHKGEYGLAENHLRCALEMGQRHGCMNLLTWRRPVMALLCSKALAAGIEVDYVKKLIRCHRLPPPAVPDFLEFAGETWPYPLKVYTLGRFVVMRHDTPLELQERGQKKPLEMLKALIALGGKEVETTRLAELLWPDSDGDAAHSAFTTTLSRLRRLLGCEGAIRVRAGAVSLNEIGCWTDADYFEALVDRYNEVDSFEAALLPLGLYQGNFLPTDLDYQWSISRRERLKCKFLRLVLRTGSALESAGAQKKAIHWYLQALDVDDHCEELYQRLMHCYLHLGHRADAKRIYNRCRNVLASTGVALSPATESLFQSVQDD